MIRIVIFKIQRLSDEELKKLIELFTTVSKTKEPS